MNKASNKATLEAANANLVSGSINAGTAAIHQHSERSEVEGGRRGRRGEVVGGVHPRADNIGGRRFRAITATPTGACEK